MANNRIYWLHALTPTHAGVGRGVGYIDLPVDRDGVTHWPVIRGSAFKGVWSDYYFNIELKNRQLKEGDKRPTRSDFQNLKVAFGISSDNQDNLSQSGSLMPTDARLVCLPVRSFRGTFAWCTSWLALRFLARTLRLAGASESVVPPVPGTTGTEAEALVANPSGLVEAGAVYLEDLNFTARVVPEVVRWAEYLAAQVFPEAWRPEFQKRFVVLPDDAFNFLTETGTEVNTRVRISDETKSVTDGALWTEESLPAETILAGVIACDRVFGSKGEDITPAGLLEAFATQPLSLQIGGKATVGRGQVRCVFTNPNGGA